MSDALSLSRERLEHGHNREAIQQRLAGDARGNYLRDWIYGGIDGTITTFAIVAGVVGANLPGTVVLVLGLANLIADGFAMGAGNYSGTKADLDDYRRLLAIERKHIALEPSGEREEIRQIFGLKGFLRVPNWNASSMSFHPTKTCGRRPWLSRNMASRRR